MIDLGFASRFRFQEAQLRAAGLLYLELLCQLATEAIKHGQVKGTKVRIEAEREGQRKKKKECVRGAIYATSYGLWGRFTG